MNRGVFLGLVLFASSAIAADGINNDFVINESPTVSIPPASSAELTYNVDASSIGGVLTPNNAVMDPTNQWD